MGFAERKLAASWLAGLAIVTLVTACSGDAADSPPAVPTEPAELVGRQTCAKCHANEHANWRGSHHDLAMQEATAATVLGDFDDAEFTHHGVTSRFTRRDGKFFVATDGPDGQLTEYEIAYTFGVTPLQQYLIRFPRGRLQALGLCWDSRPAAQGGRRWYHVYGDEQIPHGDELHWTGPNQSWNYMCASCHSTGLQKGYDLAADRYDTTWFEIDVSCEACHGGGSRHVAWAEAGGAASDPDKGLVVTLKDPALWKFDDGAVTARRDPPLAAHTQAETCAPCHSRRSVIDDTPFHGRPLADTHRVSLLDEGLYHADGQILDEVYVYGSFAQSRMYHAGVTCSDCHEPHALTLRAEGNALCTRCHMPDTFDTKSHHMHEPGSNGAACVACHMPERNYMVIDGRRDHSIRVPRPDLATTTGAPNACTGCHTDKDARWAAAAIRANSGADHSPRPHYGAAIAAGRADAAGARTLLAKLLRDAEQPPIARATAADLLERYPSREALTALEPALSDPDPLLRSAAVAALDGYPAQIVMDLAMDLLDDPVKSVRTEAGRILAAVRDDVPVAKRDKLDRTIDQFVAAQLTNADQPWAHVNIGLARTQQGRHDDAERAYRHALRLRPDWTPAYVNLADLYRELQRDEAGEAVLRDGLRLARQTAEIRHALGLLLARTDRTDKAVLEFERAANGRPDIARFAYTYGVALHSTGKVDQALQVLEQAQVLHPRDRDLLTALTTFNRDRGAVEVAIGWAHLLVARDPDDAAAAELLRSLQDR